MKKEQYATPKANTVPHYDAQALGNTIRVLRENLQLTQTELGTLSSFSTAEISKLETGARKKIPIESLIRIAPHLNVSLDYLLVQCILDYKSDHEQFYDYNGNEIDLYQIARNIYTVDSSLLLILSSPDFLADRETIEWLKEWVRLKSSIENAPEKTRLFQRIFMDFKDYCQKFIRTLSHSVSGNNEIKNQNETNKFTPQKGECI
ncbi:helix-turn-helix domain-containing protein [Blautia faecis]|uniref:helix-turn-helix domain-containing protein n=1 Tax=Blautia faecis TaxID=871665 RepID=UPI001D015C77|nr:helix-turn-helix transcriptional regulator [Blautia faecis]MCB5483333.1 helix-turn-helix domain-containing protein [Blautia faecis]